MIEAELLIADLGLLIFRFGARGAHSDSVFDHQSQVSHHSSRLAIAVFDEAVKMAVSSSAS